MRGGRLMNVAAALAEIQPLFPVSTLQNVDLSAIPPDTKLDVNSLHQIAWRYRTEHPTASLQSFVDEHIYYLIPAEITD